MASIALEGVSKQYAGANTAAVDGLSLEVQENELLVIVGPSGSGKSTTLRLIAGLEKVTHGTIRIGGRDVTRLAARERRVSLLSQGPALYPHRTVYGNLTFGWQIRYGFLSALVRRVVDPSAWLANRAEMDARVREASRLLGIEHLLGRRSWQLSGGERQRVALGKLLVRQADASLLDEPLANLDPVWRADLRSEIRAVQRQSRTAMVLVTHDQAEACSIADRIAVLHRGRLQQVGYPEDLYERPRNRFVAGFMGEGTMNFLLGRVSADGGRIWFQNTANFGSWKVDVTESLSSNELDSTTTAIGKGEVELGVPSNAMMIFADSLVEEKNINLLSGIVSQVEYHGDRSLVRVNLCSGSGLADGDIGGTDPTQQKIAVETGRGTNIRPGDKVHVKLNASQLHLFDRHSGKNLKLVE